MGSSSATDPGVVSGEALARAVAEEEQRTGAQIAVFRVGGITCFVALVGAFNFFIPGWIGGLDRLLVYWAAAGVVFVVTRTWPRLTRLSALAIPLVDIPMLFFVLSGVITQLLASEYAGDARGVALMAALFYALLVFLASFSLDDRGIYLSTGIAAALEWPLLHRAGGDWTVIPAVELGLVMVGMLAVHSNRRAIRLVHAVAAKQLFLSPEVARAVTEHGLARVMRHERVALSVVACDLRGFTAFSESAAAEEVVELLTGYYDAVGRVVTEFGGTIKDHAGDGVLCLVGASNRSRGTSWSTSARSGCWATGRARGGSSHAA
jgi:hypothetical protein